MAEVACRKNVAGFCVTHRLGTDAFCYHRCCGYAALALMLGQALTGLFANDKIADTGPLYGLVMNHISSRTGMWLLLLVVAGATLAVIIERAPDARRAFVSSFLFLRPFFFRRLFDGCAMLLQDPANFGGRRTFGEAADQLYELVPLASPDDEAHGIGNDRGVHVLLLGMRVPGRSCAFGGRARLRFATRHLARVSLRARRFHCVVRVGRVLRSADHRPRHLACRVQRSRQRALFTGCG